MYGLNKRHFVMKSLLNINSSILARVYRLDEPVAGFGAVGAEGFNHSTAIAREDVLFSYEVVYEG